MNTDIKDDKQPFEQIEELPCDLIDQETFEDETKDADNFISIDVDVFIGKVMNEDFQEAVRELGEIYVARTTKRGTRFYCGDISYNSDTGIIQFKAGTPAPHHFTNKVQYKNKPVIGTTFADFCFMNADGTKYHTIDQCQTPFRDEAEPGDLTWILPAKFVDDVVEMMSIMNNLILGGSMEEAIMYGPEII